MPSSVTFAQHHYLSDIFCEVVPFLPLQDLLAFARTSKAIYRYFFNEDAEPQHNTVSNKKGSALGNTNNSIAHSMWKRRCYDEFPPSAVDNYFENNGITIAHNAYRAIDVQVAQVFNEHFTFAATSVNMTISYRDDRPPITTLQPTRQDLNALYAELDYKSKLSGEQSQVHEKEQQEKHQLNALQFTTKLAEVPSREHPTTHQLLVEKVVVGSLRKGYFIILQIAQKYHNNPIMVISYEQPACDKCGQLFRIVDTYVTKVGKHGNGKATLTLVNMFTMRTEKVTLRLYEGSVTVYRVQPQYFIHEYEMTGIQHSANCNKELYAVYSDKEHKNGKVLVPKHLRIKIKDANEQILKGEKQVKYVLQVMKLPEDDTLIKLIDVLSL